LQVTTVDNLTLI